MSKTKIGLVAAVVMLGLSVITVGAGDPPTTAREAFDSYNVKVKAGHAKEAMAEFWGFSIFLTETYGDRFSKCSAKEQAEMVEAFSQILVGAMENQKLVKLMADSEVKNIVEFKISDDRSIMSFDFVLPDGTVKANQMEFRKTKAGWRIVDSCLELTMLSSKLRALYAPLASKQPLPAFIREMAEAGK